MASRASDYIATLSQDRQSKGEPVRIMAKGQSSFRAIVTGALGNNCWLGIDLNSAPLFTRAVANQMPHLGYKRKSLNFESHNDFSL
jgi:hypothetical protein